MPLLHPTYKNRHNYQMLKTFLRETRGGKKQKKKLLYYYLVHFNVLIKAIIDMLKSFAERILEQSAQEEKFWI